MAAGALYQTQALLVFAYVVHFGSQALRSAQVAVAAVPGRLDAARILGAGRLRRLRTVSSLWPPRACSPGPGWFSSPP